MAAPINYGQIQAALLHGIWFMDMIGSQDKRREILATIKAELDAAEQAKADLAAGQGFLTALNRMKDEIEATGAKLETAKRGIALAGAEADQIRKDARLEADKITERADALDDLAETLADRGGDLDERQKGIDARDGALTERSASLDVLNEEHDVRAGKLDEEAVRLRGIKAQLEAAGKIKI